MSGPGQPERATQRRVIALFREELGYRFLGDWSDRAGNSNIEAGLLSGHLLRAGYSSARIARAIDLLKREADHHGRGLYANNEAVCGLLRYGVKVKIDAGEQTETVHLVDRLHPENNDFAIAEEVTLHGPRERRPDLVLYLNGIRQNLSNQQPAYNAWFFRHSQGAGKSILMVLLAK